ncbi:PREDICTED: tetratricopeptide repeat protein 5-like [Nicrophorus vespilloides]|uniref:Tetratricopeptide repeat protein 5-like n=1 Tax=Nicrophorus vespilloides TaxID=110193 RepID=A0ABM1M1M9_NICVS|nr:PREDICTED: tetratricopeptide repeat protein 5-like [Nicrophorus vespilloides]
MSDDKNEEENDDPIRIIAQAVKSLYKFRDYYFEHHSIENADNRNSDIELELNKTLNLFDKYKDCAIKNDRGKYYYLKGYALNIVPKYSKEAEELLSKAIKLDPKIVEAWNELGDCYCKNNNLIEAINCFNKALNYGKNKVSLRNLSILERQRPAITAEDKINNIERGLMLAKEAVQLDPQDGHSWAVLGNAHLSAFFGISQNPKTLKQCLSAYNQAEKDVTAKCTADLHYNKAVMLKYEEEYLLAIDSFTKAVMYDPTWEQPKNKIKQLVKYLKEITDMVSSSGKMKSKKLQQLLQSVNSKLLGPYSGGSYSTPNGQSVTLQEVTVNELIGGFNEEKVVLGKVVCSVYNEETVPFTFCLVDKIGTCVVATIYNLANGRGVIIGDSVAIPEPYVTDVDFKYDGNEYKFRLIRIETPLVLVINGKKTSRDYQAGVQMSLFKKFD